MDQHFYNGFIKRAQDYGLSVVEAHRLIKAADGVAPEQVNESRFIPALPTAELDKNHADVSQKISDAEARYADLARKSSNPEFSTATQNRYSQIAKDYKPQVDELYHTRMALTASQNAMAQRNDLGTRTLKMPGGMQHHPTNPHVLIPTPDGARIGIRPTTYNPRTYGGVNPGESMVRQREFERRHGIDQNPLDYSADLARSRWRTVQNELDRRAELNPNRDRLNPHSDFYHRNYDVFRHNRQVPIARADAAASNSPDLWATPYRQEKLKMKPLEGPSFLSRLFGSK